jgi:hypothetical protein
MSAHIQLQVQEPVARIQPRPVFCPIEHLYRSRAVAEEVCAGRFTHIGVTLELGLKPDWLTAGVPEDEEWHIEWSKFYYGLDLADTYVATGDSRFLHAWESLVDSWIHQVPIERELSDVTGRRIQNWIYAWQKFASAPHFNGLAAGMEQQILKSLREQVSYLRGNLSAERNHRTLELYGLFVVALALPEIADESLLQFAMAELHRNLLQDVHPDGVHREHSTHYHMLVLRSFVAARENARRFGLSFPASYDQRLERACEFAMHCHRPDGEIPALSDSDTGNYSDVLQLAASLLGRSDFLYAATGGEKGTPPVQRYASFPDGGYYIQRSGWGTRQTPFPQERFLIFDCGALGDGGHGHYDLLNFELSAEGQPLIMDPGRYTYAENSPNLRHWFKGTAAHNTICIDHMDQSPYRCGKPKGGLPQARFVERYNAPGFDMLCGVAQSPLYDVVHTRRIFFVADEYWIIHDRVRGEQPHHIDLRFHLSSAAWERTTVLVDPGQSVVCAPGVALVFHAATVPTIEAGWIAPQYGTKLPAPVISLALEHRECADFITLIAPVHSPESAPRLRASLDRGDGSDAIVVEVNGVGARGSATDHLSWSSAVVLHEAGPFACRASAVWWRLESGESPVALTACKVQELRWKSSGKREFLNPLQPSEWLRWEGSNIRTAEQGVTL